MEKKQHFLAVFFRAGKKKSINFKQVLDQNVGLDG